jgi:hypothetical protein
VLEVSGHGGAIKCKNENVYMAIALRNAGAGLAVIHGWIAEVRPAGVIRDVPDPADFRPQQRDLYIPAGETGFWQGAIRQTNDPSYEPLSAAAHSHDRVGIDILYSDAEGGQRAIARFTVAEWPNVPGERADLIMVFNVDRDDPRQRTLREDVHPADPSGEAPTIGK